MPKVIETINGEWVYGLTAEDTKPLTKEDLMYSPWFCDYYGDYGCRYCPKDHYDKCQEFNGR